MFTLKDIAKHAYNAELKSMTEVKKEFGLEYGDRIEVGVASNGEILDYNIEGSLVKREATVVGFDDAGFPLIKMESVDPLSGAWAIHSAADALQFRMNTSAVDYGAEKYYLLFSERAFCKVNSSSTKGPSDMKFDLKVGDRVIASLGVSSGFSAAEWIENGKHIAGTVIGQKPDGNPLVYFDEGNQSLWDASYNGALAHINPSMAPKVDIHSKRCNYLVAGNAFVSEKDYKAGKRPACLQKGFSSVCDQMQVNATAHREAGDHREFLRHVTYQLPSNAYVYGEHIRDLLLKNNLAESEKTDIFCTDANSAKLMVNGLRASFSNEYVAQARTIEDGEFIKEEWSIFYRSNMPNARAHKVVLAYPKAGSTVKSPFEKGDADVNAFMIKQDGSLSNFFQKDVNAALASLINKEFSVFGQPSKELIEELVKKGFTQTKGPKGVQTKMSNAKSGDGILDILKKDFHEAKYRVAADQLTHGVKEAMLLAVKGKGGTESQLEGVSMLLDSEIGDSGISLLLGIVIMYAPMISDDPRAQKLAESFRRNGMTTAGNLVVSTAMTTLLPLVQSILAKMPADEEQVRVAETPARIAAPPVAEVSHHEEEEAVAPVAKQATL